LQVNQPQQAPKKAPTADLLAITGLSNFLAVSIRAAQSMLVPHFPVASCQAISISNGADRHKMRKRREIMKYMITWNERPQGTPIEYENAQKRILEVFGPWKAPANFKIESFVIRVGDWGGYMLMECDDPLEVHKFCSMLPSFIFEVHPVVPVADAIRVELEAMAYRDGLRGK
jgi:Protein of unknown function (DUF3303)